MVLKMLCLSIPIAIPEGLFDTYMYIEGNIAYAKVLLVRPQDIYHALMQASKLGSGRSLELRINLLL